MNQGLNILIVDDTPANLRLLTHMLTEHGYYARPVLDGAQALATAQTAPPDLILLDIRMPGMDGYVVCQRLKADEGTREIPVLFISALSETEDKVQAFAAGGVDYITKPFQLEEVLARIRGLLRRSHRVKASTEGLLLVGDLEMDETSREVRRGGIDIALTVTEFDLLRLLMLNPRQVLTKSLILDRVWQYDFGGDAHVVELFISLSLIHI